MGVRLPSAIAARDAIGMVWDVPDYLWGRNCSAAVRCHRAHGHLNVPSSFVTESGIRLRRWIRSRREVYKTTLSETRKKKRDMLDMIWQLEDPWNAKFRLVQQYYETHGHTNMPTDYVVDGVWLRCWLSEQKARLNGEPTDRSKTAKALTPE